MGRLKTIPPRVSPAPGRLQQAGTPIQRRVCRRCEKSLPATTEFFPPHKMGKFGLYTHCRPCKKLQDAERRARPDQQARQQAWRDANREKVQAYNQQYRDAGYTSTEHGRRWRAANPEASRRMEREKQARYRRTRPWLVLKERVSSRMRTMLMGCGGKAQARAEDLLGYSLGELARHLERQFTDGMSWDAFHRGEIHIDHIIPVSSFKPESAECPEFRACWALSNLRPLWARDNLSKGAKRETLL